MKKAKICKRREFVKTCFTSRRVLLKNGPGFQWVLTYEIGEQFSLFLYFFSALAFGLCFVDIWNKINSKEKILWKQGTSQKQNLYTGKHWKSANYMYLEVWSNSVNMYRDHPQHRCLRQIHAFAFKTFFYWPHVTIAIF